MDANRSVTANFTQQYTLPITNSPSTGGSVYLENNTTPTTSYTFVTDEKVTFTAKAKEGYEFTGWSGACSETKTEQPPNSKPGNYKRPSLH